MALGTFGVVIEMAVMALGEDSDAVDMGAFHGAGEIARIEVDADVADPWAGVEVEMNLAETKWRRFWQMCS